MTSSSIESIGRKLRLSPAQYIALGFAVIILVGALLLMLPISSRDRQSISFFDALFTSVSATCITGLTLFDTWTQFSGFGHAVILLLVQIGGLGFMTLAILFTFIMKKRIGLRHRTFLSEAISVDQIGGIVRLIRRILIGTLVFEAAGTVLLAIHFVPELGFWTGLWYGFFHSVSAFCNAGFDLMGRFEPGSSLATVAGNWPFSLIIMALVLVGGIGFSVWSDLYDNRFSWRKYSLHTKFVLTVTLIFFAVPAVLFFLTERNASMAGMSVSDRVLTSMFHSVSIRTAGFFTVDVGELSPGGKILTMLFMFIGGAPGSTAGGVKVSTFTVAALAIICYIRGRDDINIFDRRLDKALVHRSFCTLLFNLSLALCGAVIILAAQPLSIEDVLFEVFAAISTGGMSLGITTQLGAVSRIVIMLLMYAGRVGSLTVLVTAIEPRSSNRLRNPVGKVIV